MASNQLKHAIGTLPSRQSAEQALNQLRDAGFSMNQISVIAKGTNHNEQLSSADTSEQTVTRAEGAASGAVAGGRMGGSLFLIGGLMALLVPGIGPALAAETVLATLLGTGASTTAGGLIGALRGWFIPEERARSYAERVSRGDYLVVVEGTEDEIARAEAVLNRWGIHEWHTYNTSSDDNTSGNNAER